MNGLVPGKKCYSRRVGDDTSSKKSDQPSSDVVLIHGATEDGKGLQVLRAREQRIEVGQVRPLEHGKPVQGDIVRLRPRPGMPFICDVETQVELSEAAPRPAASSDGARTAKKGPAQVASPAYRQNWDNIWNPSGGKKTELLN